MNIQKFKSMMYYVIVALALTAGLAKYVKAESGDSIAQNTHQISCH